MIGAAALGSTVASAAAGSTATSGGLSTIIGGLGSLAGGLFGGGGGLFGGSSEPTAEEKAASRVSLAQLGLAENAYNKYSDLYNRYYWPIEEYIASNYYNDIQQARPYQERMNEYQLGRGDELINLANETNTTLDENKKDLIRRLTEGEDVLANRYRTEASADVADTYGNAYNQQQRQMAMSGINPNSGAYANWQNSFGQNQALADASARTSATRTAEDTSLNRQASALNYYTNPTMQYDAGTITPSASITSLIGGSGGSGGYGSSSGSSSGGSSSGMSGIGGITSGLAGIVKGAGSLFGF